MHSYMTQSEATRRLAAEQTHNDLHAGRGVIVLPTHDEIATRAYALYIRNGRIDGDEVQNWREAERELRAGDQAP